MGGDFPGGPVAKTLRSQCTGLGLIPGQGTRSRMPQLRPGTAWMKEKKRKKGREGGRKERKNKKKVWWVYGESHTSCSQDKTQNKPHKFPCPLKLPPTNLEWSASLFGLFFFFGRIALHVGPYFPDQGSNPCALQWKHGVLTTGPPGKSQSLPFIDPHKEQVKCHHCLHIPVRNWT